jgi:hypothetical protein
MNQHFPGPPHGGGFEPPHPQPEPFHPQPEPFHPDGHPGFRPDGPPVFEGPWPRPEPVIVPIPVEQPVEQPSNLVEVQTNIAMVFAWRDGENGPPQPPGVYFVPPDVANAYVEQGWATLV